MKGKKQRRRLIWNILLSFIIISGMVFTPVPSVLAEVDDFEGRLSGGDYHTLAVHGDGTVIAWGGNGYGGLGDGSVQSRYSPVQVKGLTDVQAVAAGYRHSLALKKDGTVWAWGANGRGQLGDGSTATRFTPVQVANLTDVKAITAGSNHSLAIKNDGTLWAWGENIHGQLGDGSDTARNIPVQVANLTDVKAVAAGGGFTLALKSDGSVWAWGGNTLFQLGKQGLEKSNIPVQVMTNIKAISSGQAHALAIDYNNNLWGWGYNLNGQLGDGSSISRSSPVKVNDNVKAVAAGYAHSLVLKEDGTLWASGYKSDGQLGDGDSGFKISTEYVRVLTDAKLIAIVAGDHYSLALTEDGAVLAWGNNDFGQLGVGDINSRNIPIPVYNLFSTDAHLQNLTLSDGMLSPSFSKYNFNYRSNVPYETEEITVTPTTGNAKVTVKVSINGGTETVVQSNEVSPPLSLRVGSNDIRVDVLAENKSVQYSYVVNVTRQSSNMAITALSDIRLGSGAVLNEPFHAGTTDYTANVPHSIESLTVMPTVIDPSSTITVSVNGGMKEPVINGEASLPLALNVGMNTITIDVVSQDRSKHNSYSLTVTRAPSDNADLAALQVNPGQLQPTFNSHKVVYNVAGVGNIDAFDVTATLADPEATLMIAGAVAANGVVETVPLNQGANLIPIVVTAADGTQKAYVLAVNGTVSNADLASLSVSSGNLAPNFSKANLSYDVHVPNDTNELTIGASPDDPKAMVIVNGSVIQDHQGETVTLQVGANIVQILVVAQDGTSKNYEVTIHRAASSNINLSGLSLSEGTLTPMFDSGVTSYSSQVANTINQLKVTATSEDSNAKLSVRINSGNYELIGNGLPSPPLPLKIGDNTIELRITAEDGTEQKTYQVTVNRKASHGGGGGGGSPTPSAPEKPKEPVLVPDEPNRPPVTFSDIVGHWADKYIKQASARGIVGGYPDGTFKPDASITRAEFTVMLVKALKLEGAAASSEFSDDKQIGAWAKQAIDRAVQGGIIAGYDDGNFRPNASITRTEMAVMFARAMDLQIDTNAVSSFADDKAIPEWAKGAVDAVYGIGIVNGRGENQFVPNGTATRAEAIAMLIRMLERESQ